MRLFTPAWQSNNGEKALMFVAKETNQTKLIEIANNAPLLIVQQAAIEKLVDQSVLFAFAMSDNHDNSRIAIRKLTDTAMLERALAKSPRNATVEIVERISNQNILKEVASYYFVEEEALRLVFEKIDDQIWLAKLYCVYTEKYGTDLSFKRNVLVDSIRDKDALEYAMQNAIDTGRIRDRLDQYRRNEVIALDNQAELEKYALNDHALEVRLEAIKKLTNQDVIMKIAKECIQEDTRRLPEIINENGQIRTTAIRKLSTKEAVMDVIRCLNEKAKNFVDGQIWYDYANDAIVISELILKLSEFIPMQNAPQIADDVRTILLKRINEDNFKAAVNRLIALAKNNPQTLLPFREPLKLNIENRKQADYQDFGGYGDDRAIAQIGEHHIGVKFPYLDDIS